MQADVAVAEAEPRLAAELAGRGERVPGLVGAPPAALLVGHARKGVEHAVEVGRDVEPEHLDVVADVADHRDVVRVDDRHDAPKEARAADAARQHGHSHAAAPRRIAASTARVLGPTRPASRSRSATVSTSSIRFGASTARDGPSAANRAALPRP